MREAVKQWISIILSILLVFCAVSGMAEEKNELQEWMNSGTEAFQQQDYGTALYYFELLADRGEAAAQANLGTMYANGLGVKQSYEKAAEYYKLAAEQGEPLAQSNLGAMYANGLGVEQSYEKALEYYQMSADQGNAWGQFNLGYCYLLGQGVEESREKAIEYFELAAAQGNEKAADELRKFSMEDKAQNRHTTQQIMDNCYLGLLALTDVYANSVSTGKETIEIETTGILIDETNNTVSLTSDVNSITFIVNDATKLKAVAGWVYYNLYLYESSDPSAFQIYLKDSTGNLTDVSSDSWEYSEALFDAYDIMPSATITSRSDKWTHLYEGTVDMLITWGMFYDAVSHFGYMDATNYPEGILYYSKDEGYYLMITDGSKGLVLSLVSEQPILSIGFGALFALHAGFPIEEIKCYLLTADQDNPNNVYVDELTSGMIDGAVSATLETVSFEDGTLHINDPLSKGDQ